jgi:hypothetical protein
MTNIPEFIRSGGTISDAELLAGLRAALLTVAPARRADWIAQTELSLDGYGGPRNAALIERVVAALKIIKTELALV